MARTQNQNQKKKAKLNSKKNQSTITKIKNKVTDIFCDIQSRVKEWYNEKTVSKQKIESVDDKRKKILEVFPLFRLNDEETFDHEFGDNEKEINSIYVFIENQDESIIIRNKLIVLFNDFIHSLINVLLTKNNLGYQLEKKKNLFGIFLWKLKKLLVIQNTMNPLRIKNNYF